MAISRQSGVGLLAAISTASQRRDMDGRERMMPSEITWLRRKRREEDAGRRARLAVAEAAAHRGVGPAR